MGISLEEVNSRKNNKQKTKTGFEWIQGSQFSFTLGKGENVPFGRFWAESGLVATFCLRVCSPWSGSPPSTRCVPWVRSSNPQRKPTWNPTSLTFGGTSSSKFTTKLSRLFFFCSLLLFPSLSQFADICYPFMLLVFSLFAVRFSACCGLLWKVVRRTRNPTHPKISHDLFLEVVWFQFFPHHRPGT